MKLFLTLVFTLFTIIGPIPTYGDEVNCVPKSFITVEPGKNYTRKEAYRASGKRDSKTFKRTQGRIVILHGNEVIKARLIADFLNRIGYPTVALPSGPGNKVELFIARTPYKKYEVGRHEPIYKERSLSDYLDSRTLKGIGQDAVIFYETLIEKGKLPLLTSSCSDFYHSFGVDDPLGIGTEYTLEQGRLRAKLSTDKEMEKYLKEYALLNQMPPSEDRHTKERTLLEKLSPSALESISYEKDIKEPFYNIGNICPSPSRSINKKRIYSRKEAYQASTNQIVLHYGEGILDADLLARGLSEQGYPTISVSGGPAERVHLFINRGGIVRYAFTQRDLDSGTLGGTAINFYKALVEMGVVPQPGSCPNK